MSRVIVLALVAFTLSASFAFSADRQVSKMDLSKVGLQSMQVVSDTAGMEVRGRAFKYPPTLPSQAKATLPTLPMHTFKKALPSQARVPSYSGNPGRPGAL